MKTHSEESLRKRRFLLVLPLLVLPFLTMAFWALGGGAGTAARASQAAKGLNLQLPEPQFKKGESSKLGLYQQARRGLQKQQRTNGQHFLHRLGLAPAEEKGTGDALGNLAPGTPAGAPGKTALAFGLAQQDPNEEKINERLSRLTQLVSQEDALPQTRQKTKAAGTPFAKSDDRFSQDVAKLETMMRTMGGGNGGAAADPEIQQLEGVLERILDIQHPERVKEKRMEKSLENQEQVFAVQATSQGPAITLLHQATSPYSSESTLRTVPRTSAPAPPSRALNAFYSLHLSPHQNMPEQQGNILEAAVHETQTLLAGATVKLRLLQDVYLGGRLLPAGSLLHGTCQIRGERLTIAVTSIRSGNSLLPVSLAAYDLDGMEGLSIPGAAIGDAARQGAGRAISQSLQLPSLSPSLGAQAMGAGLDAARGLLSKGTRQVKVTVRAGHHLLLRDQKTSF
ncbi:conjugative transposon TraM protein [Pontibacter ummariensis]|uniref:Bacteroides conjugative transposon TraM protein n=1 Tax=Pontibacter ummariensis TaxID=1610492 RepID=A0A239LEQ2_9BACT|nr:conjugative transposon protein TraM [Pontibacter ummariensis]PRY03679.1 conjugative transposon TraM protein [Pontibacter ummariensis]SNT28014.1 Bacteroides conjugative transposon TraM protein [Pontibacter ummariensis]